MTKKDNKEMIDQLENHWKQISDCLGDACLGVTRWVTAGLLLVDAKNRLPHGHFMAWVDSNLQQSQIWKPRHLAEAKRVASDLLSVSGLLPDDALKVAENPEHSFWAGVDGHTTRGLSLMIKERVDNEKEREAKEWCEEKWENSAKLRDDWEPRVLSGELTYYFAKCGMLGKEVETPKKRPATNHAEYLERNINGLSRHWKSGWDALDDERKDEFKDRFIRLIEESPEDLKRAIANFIAGGTES